MPATSRAQQRLMGAAEHGADFPMAKKVRGSMSKSQMHDFAAGSMKGKPERAPKRRGGKVGRHAQARPKLSGGFAVTAPNGFCMGGRV